MFDQFEELYSKPEPYAVCERTQRLFLSAVVNLSNLVLGFAWKTDCTVQQGHPAYFMWHRLSDHRYEMGLHPFVHADASKAKSVFEKELGQSLKPDPRRQLIENSQGYDREHCLTEIDEAHRSTLLRELLRVEPECRIRRGEEPTVEDYCGRFSSVEELGYYRT